MIRFLMSGMDENFQLTDISSISGELFFRMDFGPALGAWLVGGTVTELVPSGSTIVIGILRRTTGGVEDTAIGCLLWIE